MRIEINKENKDQYDLICKSFDSGSLIEILGCSYIVMSVNLDWSSCNVYPYKITVDLMEVTGG